MHTFRRLVLSLLALPLMLNGLWVLCHNLPPEPKTLESTQSEQSPSSDDELKAECEKLCARQSSLCLFAPGDKTSITIVAFGLAIFPSDMQISSPVVSREYAAESPSLHSDPSIAHPSPPPEA